MLRLRMHYGNILVPISVSIYVGNLSVTLRLDVCIGGLRIELVSIPIQTGNCNRHEYEFGCLDVYRIGSRNHPEVSIQNRV